MNTEDDNFTAELDAIIASVDDVFIIDDAIMCDGYRVIDGASNIVSGVDSYSRVENHDLLEQRVKVLEDIIFKYDMLKEIEKMNANV